MHALAALKKSCKNDMASHTSVCLVMPGLSCGERRDYGLWAVTKALRYDMEGCQLYEFPKQELLTFAYGPGGPYTGYRS